VIYVDSRLAQFGREAQLTFESGTMLLDGNVVSMAFLAGQGGIPAYFMDTSSAHNYYRYISSGYEIEQSQPPVTGPDGVGEFDPILFYSQNSHLICVNNSKRTNLQTAFKRRNDPGRVLLLFPDFPWITDSSCTRVKLIKQRDPGSTDSTMGVFAPTGSYSLGPQSTPHGYSTASSQLSQYYDQPPSESGGGDIRDARQSTMRLTVVCKDEDLCQCHGCLVKFNTVRKLRLLRNSPLVLTIFRMEI
jgi:hypothetical protein